MYNMKNNLKPSSFHCKCKVNGMLSIKFHLVYLYNQEKLLLYVIIENSIEIQVLGTKPRT